MDGVKRGGAEGRMTKVRLDKIPQSLGNLVNDHVGLITVKRY